MTQRKLEIFNLKINILYDKQRGYQNVSLAAKYGISRYMVRIYLQLAENNYKIKEAVRKRQELEKEKENADYRR